MPISIPLCALHYASESEERPLPPAWRVSDVNAVSPRSPEEFYQNSERFIRKSVLIGDFETISGANTFHKSIPRESLHATRMGFKAHRRRRPRRRGGCGRLPIAARSARGAMWWTALLPWVTLPPRGATGAALLPREAGTAETCMTNRSTSTLTLTWHNTRHPCVQQRHSSSKQSWSGPHIVDLNWRCQERGVSISMRACARRGGGKGGVVGRSFTWTRRTTKPSRPAGGPARPAETACAATAGGATKPAASRGALCARHTHRQRLLAHLVPVDAPARTRYHHS